jgi:hypothetical protein
MEGQASAKEDRECAPMLTATEIEEWYEMENLSCKAERFAERLTGSREPLEWGDLRDLLDLWTGGEFETIPLDILTDLTARQAAQKGVAVRWSFDGDQGR